MAVPKKKRSKSRTRTKKANWTVELPNLRACPSCGIKTVSHRACPECGQYKGRQVLQIKTKTPKTED
ncbi:50S ribosomal protein L32 [bacterium]|jgi:large subunit ribosomal protein L32|nr:50S ribosomal protein L32 [bacterium]